MSLRTLRTRIWNCYGKKTIIRFYSDLSGDEVEGDDVTLQFGLDGTNFEVDLTSKEQQQLRDALAPYVKAGRKVDRTASRRHTSHVPSISSDVASPKDIREWAMTNGYEVPTRGRIPAPVQEAYLAAH